MPYVGQYAPYVGAAYRGENDQNLFRMRINQAGVDAGTSPLSCGALLEKGDPYDPAWGRVDVDAGEVRDPADVVEGQCHGGDGGAASRNGRKTALIQCEGRN